MPLIRLAERRREQDDVPLVALDVLEVLDEDSLAVSMPSSASARSARRPVAEEGLDQPAAGR